jgi:polar amino acid transport system permease protein
MHFSPSFALSILPDILNYLGTTLGVAIAGCLGATLLGFTWEVLRRSHRVAGLILRVLIDCIRSTPVLVQIYFLYFVLPAYGVTIPALAVGIIALSLYYSGYLAEVFKGGIDAIPAGQFEAARALGLGRGQLILLVIAPQMLRNVAAPTGSYFISLLKATPYLAIIAVPEMFGAALDIASDSFRYAEPMFVAGAVFLLLALVLAQMVRWIERSLATVSAR